MATAQVTIIGRNGKTFPSLDAWIKHVAEKDIPLILPAVATAELNEAKASGNTPSNILVDGRPATESEIARATRRVQLFFVDVEMLTRAVRLAFDELVHLYHRKTGEAARTIQVWGRTAVGGSIKHERLGGIDQVHEYLMRNRRTSTYIRLIGPDVPHRRALYYSPPGAKSSFRNISRVSSKRLSELERKGGRARVVAGKRKALVQIQSTQNISEIVTRRIKALYGRAVYVSARWLSVPVPPWKGVSKRRQGVPAVAIGWRHSGILGVRT